VKESIVKNGEKVFTIAADLSSASECKVVVEEASKLMDGIDILINTAGINRRKPIDDVTPEDFDAIVSVNMKAIYFISQAVHPIMTAAGGGTIVNMSSLSARYSFNTISVYAATKAAVSSITRSSAREWAKDKIRVNCIEPSVIKTDFTKPLWGEPHRSKWFDETTPIGRLSNPDEIIGSVIFLATDASSYITGQSIVIDGGILSGADWDSYA
jgi:NAD(P)-dependent dehydrogenase (short-subunit alcohol dehydrogenase family)